MIVHLVSKQNLFFWFNKDTNNIYSCFYCISILSYLIPLYLLAFTW